MPPFLLAALSLAQMLAAQLHLSKAGAAQPSALGDAISQIVAIVEAGGPQKPNSVDAILTDLLDALKVGEAVLPQDVAVRLDSIQSLLTKSQASIANLKNGQVAQVAEITMSFDGVSVPVDVFAIRQDSKTNVATDLGLAG